jgi:hypothetical protein
MNAANFFAKFTDATTGLFKAGQNRGIGSDKMRTMITDIVTSIMFWEDRVKDENDMASDSNQHVPTQKSVKAYVESVTGGSAERPLPWKAYVEAATTAPITLSGLQTIDGRTLSSGDRVLVKNQADNEENGIYVAVSGAWAFADDYNTDPLMAVVGVLNGATNGGTWWKNRNENYEWGRFDIPDASSTAWLDPVYYASTALDGNINIANPYPSIDGETVYEGIRVLLKHQTTTNQNKIYEVDASGYLIDSGDSLEGAVVVVTAGDTNADKLFKQVGPPDYTWTEVDQDTAETPTEVKFYNNKSLFPTIGEVGKLYVTTAAASTYSEVLLNGDFDGNLDNWTNSGSGVDWIYFGGTGNAAGQFTYSASPQDSKKLLQSFSQRLAGTYKASLRWRSPIAYPGSMTIKLVASLGGVDVQILGQQTRSTDNPINPQLILFTGTISGAFDEIYVVMTWTASSNTGATLEVTLEEITAQHPANQIYRWNTVTSQYDLLSAAYGKQDLYIPASAMWPRATNGCATLARTEIATSLLNIQTLDFDQTTQEFAQFTIVPPRNWNKGTIKIKPYWTAAAGSGSVVWGVSGGAYSNDDALSTAFGTAQTVTDTLMTANDLHIGPESADITLAGLPQDADFIALQISRNPADGSDTLNADAKLLGIVVTLTTDAAVAE